MLWIRSKLTMSLSLRFISFLSSDSFHLLFFSYANGPHILTVSSYMLQSNYQMFSFFFFSWTEYSRAFSLFAFCMFCALSSLLRKIPLFAGFSVCPKIVWVESHWLPFLFVLSLFLFPLALELVGWNMMVCALRRRERVLHPPPSAGPGSGQKPGTGTQSMCAMCVAWA